MDVAVVFDFDGTLADSYSRRDQAHERVSEYLSTLLDDYGYVAHSEDLFDDIAEAEKESMSESKWDRDQWWMDILTNYGFRDPPADRIREATEIYWDKTIEETDIYPGVEKMLDRLHSAAVPVGLISDTDGLDGMKNRRITQSGLSEYFDTVVVAGEDTAEPKPSPEPFRRVASQLDVDPGTCLYVGDNPNTDITGAREVGMTTVLLTHGDDLKIGPDPDHCARNVDELSEFINEKLEATNGMDL
jgi:HAD superfamily hydrolase (TIGR01662 family)